MQLQLEFQEKKANIGNISQAIDAMMTYYITKLAENFPFTLVTGNMINAVIYNVCVLVWIT